MPLTFVYYMLIAHVTKRNGEYIHCLNHTYRLIMRVNHY